MHNELTISEAKFIDTLYVTERGGKAIWYSLSPEHIERPKNLMLCEEKI